MRKHSDNGISAVMGHHHIISENSNSIAIQFHSIPLQFHRTAAAANAIIKFDSQFDGIKF